VSDRASAVSVCIRAFGRPEGLRTAIESVLAQTFQDFEVVVSDDSGDMEAVAGAYRDPRVRYHRNPSPAGQVPNITTSFGLARGGLLALLDDDDRWLPGFLEAAVSAFDGNPEVGVVFTDVYLEAGARRLRRRPALAPGRHDGFLRRLLDDCPVVLSAAVMRRAVWEQGERDHPLDPSSIGDITMWIRAALGGWQFHYVDKPLVGYRLHTGQLSWRPGMQARVIRLYERFRFDDPDCERLRRARLAEARLAQAGALLWGGRLGGARREIALARSTAPGPLGLRGLLAASGLRPRLVRLTSVSPQVMLAALRGWRAIRPPVDPDPRALGRVLDGIEGWLGLREARALHDAAFRHGCATPALAVVEIGSWKGRSAIAIASGLDRAGAGFVYAVDPHERATYEALCLNVAGAGLEPYVRPLRTGSTEARARFGAQSVGMLFVDGSHRYEDVVADIESWLPLLSDGATVAFHDAAGIPDVARALRARVLSDRSGFDRPRFVQSTLFVTRAMHDRSLGRSRWSRLRGRVLLRARAGLARTTSMLLPPLRRMAPGLAARRAARKGSLR
jgi:hypothetical protein